MDRLIAIRVTHAHTRNGQLLELGAMEEGRLLWRLTAAAVKTLYRYGVRFFMKTAQGKDVEIYLAPATPHRDEGLRTRRDDVNCRLLLTLPEFKTSRELA